MSTLGEARSNVRVCETYTCMHRANCRGLGNGSNGSVWMNICIQHTWIAQINLGDKRTRESLKLMLNTVSLGMRVIRHQQLLGCANLLRDNICSTKIFGVCRAT